MLSKKDVLEILQRAVVIAWEDEVIPIAVNVEASMERELNFTLQPQLGYEIIRERD